MAPVRRLPRRRQRNLRQKRVSMETAVVVVVPARRPQIMALLYSRKNPARPIGALSWKIRCFNAIKLFYLDPITGASPSMRLVVVPSGSTPPSSRRCSNNNCSNNNSHSSRSNKLLPEQMESQDPRKSGWKPRRRTVAHIITMR